MCSSVRFLSYGCYSDTNSFRILWSLESKIEDLEHHKAELIRQIQEDKMFIKKLSDSIELENLGVKIIISKRRMKIFLSSNLETA